MHGAHLSPAAFEGGRFMYEPIVFPLAEQRAMLRRQACPPPAAVVSGPVYRPGPACRPRRRLIFGVGEAFNIRQKARRVPRPKGSGKINMQQQGARLNKAPPFCLDNSFPIKKGTSCGKRKEEMEEKYKREHAKRKADEEQVSVFSGEPVAKQPAGHRNTDGKQGSKALCCGLLLPSAAPGNNKMQRGMGRGKR